MDQKFIILRIFKFREKKKTRLKSDFGLFFEIDFLICNIVYQQMERRGNSFEIQRIFQQEGKYSYAFFVKRFGSGGYPRISQQGLSVNVKLPIRIPPEGDDYKKFVNINKSSDQWDFDVKQCVSWVALKVNQMWGTEKDYYQ